MSVSEDPVVRSGRREAVAAMCIWLAAMTYTIGYCWLFGYGRDPASIRLIWGVPDWVLWGVVTPWTICTLLAAGLAFVFMQDADLGDPLSDCDEPPSDDVRQAGVQADE